MSDKLVTNNLWFKQREPLIGQQMLTAERVMTAVGHMCKRWLVPLASHELATLPCGRCGLCATIQLVEGPDEADYTVLLFPPGGCAGGETDAQ